MKQGAATLIKHIQVDDEAMVIVDSDCDGFTSAATLINYLHDIFPYWVENKLSYTLHSGKQHGLNDHMSELEDGSYKLVIIPDAGSNDATECQALKEMGVDILILDHHDKATDNPYAIIINNQMSDYPNKQLSGVGVVWQFCRYIDSLLNVNYAENYIDLAALGNCGDMMEMTSIETKHIIQKGFANLHNPFIVHMADKNAYSIGDTVTPIGAAFYIVPFVNAIVRSGTLEEKELIFESMLTHKAFQMVLSTKRGHKPGEQEQLVTQAIRVATNVKARQTRIQDNALETLTALIEDEHLLDHKVLFFQLSPGDVDRNVAGLIANKFMSKYQRPVCMLTKVSTPDGITYQGSARGCALAGIDDFKELCMNTGVVEWAIGHPNAFGICIKAANVNTFIESTDTALKDMNGEAVYHVDYIYHGTEVNGQDIISIAGMKDLWGTGLDEAFVAVERLKVSPDMVTLYQKKTNTIKISLPNKVDIMLFNAKDIDIEKLQTNNTGFVELNLVAKCNENQWMGNSTPQLFIEAYEICDSNKFFF